MTELHLSLDVDDLDYAVEFFEHIQDAYASMRRDEF